MSHSRLNTNTQAILWVTASVGLFSLVFASGKLAGNTASAMQILFIRYVSGIICLLIILMAKNKSPRVYVSKKPAAHLARAFFGSFSGVAAIYAASRIPIVDATAIGLLDTVFLIILGVILLKESISKTHGLAIAICFAGAAVIVLSRGAFQAIDVDYWIPALAALLSAVFIAIESIMIKKLSTSEQRMTVLLYVNSFGVILMLIPAILTWQSLSQAINLPFLLLGPIAIFAQYLTIRGYQLANVSIVGPVNYTWLLFAAGIGLFVFNEIPAIETLIGSALIVAGGILLILIKPATKNRDES